MPNLKIGYYVEEAIRGSIGFIGGPISVYKTILDLANSSILTILAMCPVWLIIIAIPLILVKLTNRNTAVFAFGSLLLIWNLGLWQSTIETVGLVMLSAVVSLCISIPIGVVAAENQKIGGLVLPIMDGLQTLPRFVFLIPAITLFGIGIPAAVAATTTLAVPPTARLVFLGVSNVDKAVIEAGLAMGCSRYTLLTKIKLPLAKASIVLGISQCIMMCLVMVVICALVGAGGLGANIVSALYALNIGDGVEAGVAVLLLAMMIDRSLRVRFIDRKLVIQKFTVEKG